MGFEDRDYIRNSSGYTDQFGSWGLNLSTVPPVVKYLVAANIVVFLLQIFFTRPMTQEEIAAFYAPYVEFRNDSDVPAEVDNTKETPGAAPTEEGSAPAEETVPVEIADDAWLPRVSIVQKWLELDTRKVLRGQVWRLITCAFCHDRTGIFHIVFNMLFLWWFGKTLELMYGSREFLLFYMTAALVASLAYVGLDLLTDSNVPAIGASGAVMGVTMLYACLYPRDTIRVMFLFPLEIRWLVLFYVIYDLHPVLLALAGEGMYTGVAHAAHLGGLAFGFIYWKNNLRLEPYWNALPRFRLPTTSGMRIYKEPPDASPARRRGTDAEDQVDQILKKIGEQGIDSLTTEERGILEQASARYRNR